MNDARAEQERLRHEVKQLRNELVTQKRCTDAVIEATIREMRDLNRRISHLELRAQFEEAVNNVGAGDNALKKSPKLPVWRVSMPAAVPVSHSHALRHSRSHSFRRTRSPPKQKPLSPITERSIERRGSGSGSELMSPSTTVHAAAIALANAFPDAPGSADLVHVHLSEKDQLQERIIERVTPIARDAATPQPNPEPTCAIAAVAVAVALSPSSLPDFQQKAPLDILRPLPLAAAPLA
jgi:hypothetical protein